MNTTAKESLEAIRYYLEGLVADQVSTVEALHFVIHVARKKYEADMVAAILSGNNNSFEKVCKQVQADFQEMLAD